MGARKNGAREEDTQGKRELPLPSRVFRAPVFFFSPKYIQAPATQATTVVVKIDGKFIPFPQIKDGKVACFGCYAASSFLLGGFGFAVPYYSVQGRSISSYSHSILLNRYFRSCHQDVPFRHV